ncbi:MAG: Crp/Fnr family transcriptional regulator [Micavibrio aeruginosavorus]|uniref:Crp/Fnr family transcriptional regulator n=1 Tax=Micavibrio aeruginosavorus TaxID=349221 RepID=A0A7T5R4A4_9BACT|nr:MAG: Crp/Fnr family transcriptional regulator [Micavibrio aeruginosavorus]
MNTANALKKTALFSGMDDEKVALFASKSLVRHYEKGEELFAMGDQAASFFFIIDGWVKLYRITREGEESIINVFAPHETFAEAAVFGPMQRYPVNAQAVEDTTLLEIPRSLFVETIRADSDLAISILGAIAAKQHYLIQQIEQLTVREAPQRIGTFLLRLCPPGATRNIEVALPYDKSLIARRLNIQPETFSRAFKKLEPHGVHLQGRVAVIEEIGRLAAFCDVEDRDKPC